MWVDTALMDYHTSCEFEELIIVGNGELQVTWVDSLLAGGISDIS